MSTSVELLGLRKTWEPPAAKPLDQAVWQAWVEKGRAQDERSGAARMKAVKCVSIAWLLATAGLWSHLASFDIAVRFIVTAGAVIVMLQAFHAGQYGVSAVFGALALLYNPVAPVFNFSGDWQRVAVVVSAVPFVASLAWRNAGNGTK